VKGGRTPLGVGFYFIDVLGCVLFCLVMTLAAARLGREHAVAVELPELAAAARLGPSPAAREIRLREGEAGASVWLDGEPVSLPELAQRLRDARPPAVVVRSETSLVSRVVGIAHAAGVRQIEMAYEAPAAGPEAAR
jgi:hypothetical protein